MSVILQWEYASEIIEEPFANTASTSYTMTLTNVGTNTASNIGFFLKQASVEGDISNPSTEGIISDWYDTLVLGSASGSPTPGFFIIQDGSPSRFNFDLGHSSEFPIPLTIGSGLISSNIAPGESVELTFQYVPQAGDPTRRLYIEVDITYTEI